MKYGFDLNNWPIRYKLIFYFLLVSIIPSIALGAIIGWTVDRVLEQQLNDNTLQIISKVNKTLEFYVGHMQNMTYLISFHPDIQLFLERGMLHLSTLSETQHELRKFLQSFTTLYPEVAGLLVINDQGEYISNELYARSTKNLTTESWYQEAVNNKGIFTIIGHPFGRQIASHVDYKENEVITVVRAILDPHTQQVKGVILIDLKLRIIAETVKDVRLGKTGYLMVINDVGETIYSPVSKKIDPWIDPSWFNGQNSGSFSRQVDGESFQFVYRTSSFTNWITVGVFPSRESVVEVKRIHFYLVTFVFLVCMFGIAASYYLSHSMSRPIGQLISFMRKAESGDLNIRYIGERSDEVGMLGRNFNKMLMQIQQLLKLTERHEKQKREAELRTLQAYIKPHFLYNTLDTIQWMARNKGAYDIAELTDSLSKLFRLGLNRGVDRITLGEEIAHIDSYLNIQKVRYQDKLSYTIEVEEHLYEAIVLKMILQPIVENAIYHGIKERRGPGKIEIRGFECDGNLLLTVQDDGVGMEKERLSRLQQQLDQGLLDHSRDRTDRSLDINNNGERIGYGLSNVQARIQLTFGESYGITLESELSRGMKVTIMLPLQKVNRAIEREGSNEYEVEGADRG